MHTTLRKERGRYAPCAKLIEENILSQKISLVSRNRMRESTRDVIAHWRGAFRRISSVSPPKDAIEALEQLPSSLLHTDRVPYQGSASSKPAASHDGAAAGDAINLRNSIAAEAD